MSPAKAGEPTIHAFCRYRHRKACMVAPRPPRRWEGARPIRPNPSAVCCSTAFPRNRSYGSPPLHGGVRLWPEAEWQVPGTVERKAAIPQLWLGRRFRPKADFPGKPSMIDGQALVQKLEFRTDREEWIADFSARRRGRLM